VPRAAIFSSRLEQWWAKIAITVLDGQAGTKRGRRKKKTAALFEGPAPQFGAMVVPAGTSRHRGGAIHAIVGGAGIRWE
jgi:hypothetical protein